MVAWRISEKINGSSAVDCPERFVPGMTYMSVET